MRECTRRDFLRIAGVGAAGAALAGAGRVRVMDSPFGSQADEAYKNSGIQAAVDKAGGRMESMAPAKFRDYTIPAGLDIKQWPIYSGILSYVLGVILDSDGTARSVPISAIFMATHHPVLRRVRASAAACRPWRASARRVSSAPPR